MKKILLLVVIVMVMDFLEGKYKHEKEEAFPRIVRLPVD